MSDGVANGPAREGLFPIKHVVDRLDGAVGLSCIYRWCHVGIRVASTRKRIRLKAVRIGGRYYTTQAAIDEFIKMLESTGGFK